MPAYQQELIPAIEEAFEALSSHLGRTLGGESVITWGLRKAIDRRISIACLLESVQSHVGTQRSMASLDCVSIVKTIIAYDDSDTNQFSIPLIFSNKRIGLVRKWAERNDVPLSTAKKFLKNARIKNLIDDAENHYVDLYARFKSIRDSIGAKDNSSEMYASYYGENLRANWIHPTESTFARICGGNIAEVKKLPMTTNAWDSFLQKRFPHVNPVRKVVKWKDGIKSPKKTSTSAKKRVKSKPSWLKKKVTLAVAAESDNDDDLTLSEFGKKQGVFKYGGVFEYGVCKVSSTGARNPYFERLVTQKEKKMMKI